MANADQTKIEPQTDDADVEYQRPSPLNGVALPRPRKASRNAEKHGFHTFKRTVLKLGKRAIDGRSGVAKALKRWKGELVSDLGGRDNVSTAELAIIDLAVKQKFLLDSIDAWLLLQDTLIHGSRRKAPALIPVVKERQAVANALADYLSTLGLKRRPKTLSLQEILAEQPADTDHDDHDPAPVNGTDNAG
jgi:hypothetical protein